MGRSRRISDETAAVLGLFLAEPERQRYGREVILETKLKSGSLYPILRRLEQRSLLVGSWEPIEQAAEHGRRPRRLYRLSPRATKEAEGLMDAWRSAQRRERHSPVGKVRPA